MSGMTKVVMMTAALNIYEQYDKGGDETLDYIVSGDETWVLYFTPKTNTSLLSGTILCKIMATGFGTIMKSSYMISCLKGKQVLRLVKFSRNYSAQFIPLVRFLFNEVLLLYDRAFQNATQHVQDLLAGFK